MQLNEVPRDRQTQSQSALLPRNRSFRLTKTIEHVRQELRRDAVAGIADCQSSRRLDAVEIDAHTAAPLRKLDRVGEQIPDDLPQTIWVAFHQTLFGHKARLQSDAFHVGSRTQGIERS